MYFRQPHIENNRYYYKKEIANNNIIRKNDIKTTLYSQFERVASLFNNRYAFCDNPLEMYDADNNKNKTILNNILDTTEYIYWIGHSTCIIRVKLEKDLYYTFLTDPIEHNVSILYPRYFASPLNFDIELPIINYVLLSSNRLDHFNYNTLKKLIKQQPICIVPKGDKDKMVSLGFLHVHELNWWEHYHGIIYAVPSNYISGQGYFDQNKTLFNGYIIRTYDNDDIYFAGNSYKMDDCDLETIFDTFSVSYILTSNNDGINISLKNFEFNKNKDAKTIYIHRATFRLDSNKPNDIFETIQNEILRETDTEKKQFLRQSQIVPKFGQLIKLDTTCDKF